MRLPARIAGVFFILIGLGFLAGTLYLSSHQDSVIAPTPQDWRVVFGGGVLGLGFCAAGVYIFKPETSRPGNRGFREFLARHVRELRIFAYLGCAVALIRFVAICFGVVWPGRWLEWPLTAGIIILIYATSNVVQVKSSRRWRLIIKRLEGVAFILYLLESAGIQRYASFSYRDAAARFAFASGAATLYALEALYLSLGEPEIPA